MAGAGIPSPAPTAFTCVLDGAACCDGVASSIVFWPSSAIADCANTTVTASPAKEDNCIVTILLLTLFVLSLATTN